MSRPTVLIAAGGTGGHLFPAEALAVELGKRGVDVVLATDRRGLAYKETFPAISVHAIRAATPSAKSPIGVVKAIFSLVLGLFEAFRLIGQVRPAAVVGFGGYPSVPPVLAGWMRGVPTLLHEQNGVLGRANRFLAHKVSGIGAGFVEIGTVSADLRTKMRHVGNPVRPKVLTASQKSYSALSDDGPIRLLVTGGSQGARVMSDVVPQAIGLLPPVFKERLVIVHQARGDDLARAQQYYDRAGVTVDIRPFFDDLPDRIANAHLVIGRAGASTVAELAVIGRASILVPLPGSLDQDQAANARTLGEIGAAYVMPQETFTPTRLAALMTELFSDPQKLTDSGRAAKSAGIPDAAARFADQVLSVAGLNGTGSAAR